MKKAITKGSRTDSLWAFPLKKMGDSLVNTMLLPVLGLLIVGIINVKSSTLVVDANTPLFKTLFFKHLLFIGVFASLGAWVYGKIDYRKFSNLQLLSTLCFIVLILLCIATFFGVTVNGATRWISLGVITMQPSEIAKLFGVLWVAYWIAGLNHRHHITVAQFGMAMLFPSLYAIVTIMQPDMGTAVLLLAFPFSIIFFGGISKRFLVSAGILAGIVGTILVLIAPYRLERVKYLWDPFSRATEEGYQAVQGMIAIGSGGFWGQGLLKGTSKYLYLPEAHTDFAFAIWAQEMGFIGTVFVVALLLWFSFGGFSIAYRTKNVFGSLVAYGITLLVSVQGFFNILMVTGTAPVTGVPLPFVSYGGSSMLTNILAVAILANIAKYTKIEEIKELERIAEGK